MRRNRLIDFGLPPHFWTSDQPARLAAWRSKSISYRLDHGDVLRCPNGRYPARTRIERTIRLTFQPE